MSKPVRPISVIKKKIAILAKELETAEQEVATKERERANQVKAASLIGEFVMTMSVDDIPSTIRSHVASSASDDTKSDHVTWLFISEKLGIPPKAKDTEKVDTEANQAFQNDAPKNSEQKSPPFISEPRSSNVQSDSEESKTETPLASDAATRAKPAQDSPAQNKDREKVGRSANPKNEKIEQLPLGNVSGES